MHHSKNNLLSWVPVTELIQFRPSYAIRLEKCVLSVLGSTLLDLVSVLKGLFSCSRELRSADLARHHEKNYVALWWANPAAFLVASRSLTTHRSLTWTWCLFGYWWVAIEMLDWSSMSSSTCRAIRWSTACGSGELGPGEIVVRQMFKGLFRILGGRLRHVKVITPVNFVFPPILRPHGLNQSMNMDRMMFNEFGLLSQTKFLKVSKSHIWSLLLTWLDQLLIASSISLFSRSHSSQFVMLWPA